MTEPVSPGRVGSARHEDASFDRDARTRVVVHVNRAFAAREAITHVVAVRTARGVVHGAAALLHRLVRVALLDVLLDLAARITTGGRTEHGRCRLLTAI